MKHHAYIKFKSIYLRQFRMLNSFSEQMKSRLMGIQSFSVSIYCIYRRVAPSQSDFPQLLSADSQAAALGYECMSSAATRGQASVSCRVLTPKGK